MPNNAHIGRVWIQGMLVFSQQDAKPVCMCQDAGMRHAHTSTLFNTDLISNLDFYPLHPQPPTPSMCKNTWSCFFLLSIHQSLPPICIKNTCAFRGETGLGDIKHGWRKAGRINKVVSRKAALQTLSALSEGQGSTVFIKSWGYRATQTKRTRKTDEVEHPWVPKEDRAIQPAAGCQQNETIWAQIPRSLWMKCDKRGKGSSVTRLLLQYGVCNLFKQSTIQNNTGSHPTSTEFKHNKRVVA